MPGHCRTLIVAGQDARPRTTSCGRVNFSTSRRCSSRPRARQTGSGPARKIGGSSEPVDRDAEGTELGGDGRDGVRVVRVDGPAGGGQAEGRGGPGRGGGGGG